MRILFDKLKPQRDYVGRKLIFAIWPRYIDGQLVWMEKVWKRSMVAFHAYLLFPRCVRVTLGYEIYNKDKS